MLSSTCLFKVVIADSIPPEIDCPSDIVSSPQINMTSALIFFDVNATDNVGVTALVCNPASGSRFALGITVTTCTASDAAGNTCACMPIYIDLFPTCIYPAAPRAAFG